MAIDGLDLRERPWQPGLDDSRFSQQPRNPNFTGGPSPQAAAYQRANDLRGMSGTERPWTRADAKTFGTQPAGTASSPAAGGGRAGAAANTLRDGYAYTVGRGKHFGPQQPATFKRKALSLAGGAAAAAGAGYELLDDVVPVITDPNSTKIDVATQTAEGAGRLAAAGAGSAAGAKLGALAGSPLGPVGAFAGGALGGLAGGAAGYFGADGAIRSLRGAAGVTPESPVEQVRARQIAALNAPAGQAQAQAQAQAQPQPQPPTQAQVPQAAPGTMPQATNNVIRNGNSYSGGNIAGDITVDGMPSGYGGSISPQNMAAADALAQRDSLRSVGAAASASQMPMAQSPTVRHSGNDWQARNDLRNLEVSASSITENGGQWDRRGRSKTSAATTAYNAAMARDIALRGSQAAVDVETNRSNNTLRGEMFGAESRADASRYTADQSLRGDIFKAGATDRAARYSAAVDARKSEREQQRYETERRDKSTERLDKVFASYAAGKDGKVDEGRLAGLRNNAQAFIGSAIEAARRRGDTATAQALERQGLTALADDPAMMQRYASSMKADGIARDSWGNTYTGTDNPGGRQIAGVNGGDVVFSDGTTAPRTKIEYLNNGILPHRFADWDPTADRTTEFDSIDPNGYLRKVNP